MSIWSKLKGHQNSLTASTLRAVAFRISLVITMTALLTYWHLSDQVEENALQTLEKYVRERSLREREIFKLAGDNHVAMRKELIEVFRKIEKSNEDPVREFNSLVQLDPDGALRSPRARPGVKKELDIWIAKNARNNALFRRKVVNFSKVLLRYAPAFHVRFTDTYIALGENANLVYWPEFPDWSAGNPADFDFTSYELYKIGSHENNPERKTLWSGVYFDDAIKEWMVSASTPYDDSQGNFAGIIGHDVMIGDLIQRTTNDSLLGTYNILINSDGRLIAHPKKMEMIVAAKGELKVADSKDPELVAIFDEIKKAGGKTGEKIIDQEKYDQFIAVSNFPETNWHFVTIYPKSLIRQVANQTAMVVIILGLASLITELVVLYMIFRTKVSVPLGQFIQATHDIERGKEAVNLPVERKDEIGELSRSFDSMAKRIREVSDLLRQKIEQRTKELQQAEQVASKNAHAAGMAEIATNILHNIGNTLNSVNLSMLQMEEALESSHMKNLEKALKMIDDHRDNLGDYFTNDPKGKLLPQYLSEVGKAIGENHATSIETFQYLLRKVKMIEDIVSSQQQYVKMGRFMEDVTMEDVVRESIGMLGLGNPRENFRLVTHFDDVPPVRGQRVKIMQIVINLLKNALESIGSASSEKIHEIEVRLTQEGTYIVLSIRDTGIGVAAENLDKIFSHGFTTKKDGHGFGLHFCANAARELAGSLKVESPGENKGATFILRLPASKFSKQ